MEIILRMHILHFISYFFTGFIGNFINYLAYVVLLKGYLAYILTDKPPFYILVLLVCAWVVVQNANR